MSIIIQPKRVFEGKIEGAVDTANEALVAEVLNAPFPK